MRFEDWAKSYCPIKNHLDSNASVNGFMFETFGEERAWVSKQPRNCVWTLLDFDEKSVIVPGIRMVNRLGHFVTREPYNFGVIGFDFEVEV
jgi:hypothetical protein